MQRREFAKTVGGIAGTTAVGAGGLLAASGGAAAGNTNVTSNGGGAITTDDGQVYFVSFGGRLRFTWDGLDSSAEYGSYEIETRVREKGDDFESWRSHGGKSVGQLGASWGGSNDTTDQTGSDGLFEFLFGFEHGQKDYAIAYDDVADLDPDGDGENNVHPVPNNWTADFFEPDEDGTTQVSQVEVRMTATVYDGDPQNGGSALVSDTDSARFDITVENRPATGQTGGEVGGTVAGDDS